MSRTLLVAAVGAALLCASSTEAPARGRNRPVRKVPAAGADGKTTPTIVPTAGPNALQRRPGGTVYQGASAPQHRPPPAGSPPRTATARAQRDAVRGHAWAYAGRLRRTGSYLWSAMFGAGVALSQIGVQVGKALSSKPLESLLDTVTSPHVLVASLVPSFLAVLVGELLKHRYTRRAEAIEASVNESYQADQAR